MPRNIDYSKSLIYGLYHIESGELFYIGSTTNFTKRKQLHKFFSNNIPERQKILYGYINEIGGFNAIDMRMIEEYQCENKLQLLRREGELIRGFKTKCNMSIAGRSDLESKQNYYNNIKFESEECICGSTHRKYNKSKHLKTKKHQAYINGSQSSVPS